jgi:hypothetical protein
MVQIDTSKTIEGSVALGRGAQASGGQIALSNGTKQLTISRDGTDCSLEVVCSSLREIFGESEPGFFIKTPQASLKIDKEGVVFVNDVVVGSDPKILTQALTFLLSLYVEATAASK